MNRSASSVWDDNQSDLLCRRLQPDLYKSPATISNLEALTITNVTLFEMSANLHYSTRPNSGNRSSGFFFFNARVFALQSPALLTAQNCTPAVQLPAFVRFVTFGSITDLTFESARLAIALLLTVT